VETSQTLSVFRGRLDEATQKFFELQTSVQTLLATVDNQYIHANTNCSGNILPPSIIGDDLSYIIHDYDVNVAQGWYMVIAEYRPYENQLAGIATKCAKATQVIFGCVSSSSWERITIGAIAPISVLELRTAKNQVSQVGSLYWYYTPEYSFGFSASPIINMHDSIDLYTSIMPEARMSWPFRGSYKRCGTNKSSLSDVVVYVNAIC
jgi:hypothetical protein